MAYAALQDLIDRFSETELTNLTDRTGHGVPDATVIGRALDDASQQIDSYLASRYVLPLNPVPQPVLRWCCAIARFYLYKDEVSDAVKTLYGTAIAELKLAQAGQLTLEASAIDAPTTGGAAVLDGPRRTFDSNSLRHL